MDRKYIDPRKQFSKWLAKSGAIYWFIYNTLLLILICIRPEAAMPCVYLAIVSSIVMIIHVIEYTRNSIGEKALLTLANRTDIDISLGNGKKNKGLSNNTEGGDSDEMTEEGGNG